MSKPVRQSASVALGDAPSSSGPMLARSSTSDQEDEDTGSLTSAVLPPNQPVPQGRQSVQSTPVSPRASNSLTSTLRSKHSKQSTPTTRSSVTVPQGSISSAKACNRFYSSLLKDVYESCALPTETAFAASHTILSSSYSASMERRSVWSQTTLDPPPSSGSWPRMSSLSLPFLALDSTAREAQGARKKTKTAKPPPTSTVEEQGELKRKQRLFQRKETLLDGQMRTYKVLMLPTSEQQEELKRCFAVARQAYNHANALRKANPSLDLLDARWLWRQHTKRLPSEEVASAQNARPVATKIAAHAVKQLYDAYKSNEAKKARREWLNAKYPENAKPPEVYEVKDRSLKESGTEVIIIEKYQPKVGSGLLCFVPLPGRGKRCTECLAFFGNNLKDVGGILLQDSSRCMERMVAEGKELKEDAKILWDKATGKFYFIYAFTQPILSATFSSKRIVATDPGCYPFQAWYSPTSGCHGELMHGGSEDLKMRLEALEALQARIQSRGYKPPKTSTRTRKQHNHTTKRLKRKLAREQMRQHEWVRNAHYDAANFLLRSHDIVIQPILNVAKLVKKHGRNIGKQTSKVMLAWSHFKFRQRLRSAAFRYPGRHVFETKEPGTSKTCTNCGQWNADLQVQDKVYICPSCGIQVNRQTAGARNNFFAAYGCHVGIGWDGLSL